MILFYRVKWLDMYRNYGLFSATYSDDTHSDGNMDTSHVSRDSDVVDEQGRLVSAGGGRSRLNSTGLGADFREYVSRDHHNKVE